jgi:phosphopantothenoylcysteine decarboxylase/phosphopantothenate--cysteine ligase
MPDNLQNAKILLIISGGVAAYKSLELIRLLKKSGASVRCILSKGGAQFITPLSVASISGAPVYDDLWSLKDETEMGHIRLSREADLIVIAPASANMMAKMAHGIADDLASTTLLAADKTVLIAPAMNYKMWEHPATQANIQTLKSRGVSMIGPNAGDMACGEHGMGRMAEPEEILEAIFLTLSPSPNPLPDGERALYGRRAIITAGPTFEAIDPVRFIGNRSSGKQGFEIAKAMALAGAKVTFIHGPLSFTPIEANIKAVSVTSAAEMLKACESALPADIFIGAAAVADWAPVSALNKKIKKGAGAAPVITLKENPDILKTIAHHKKRPRLVIGFAAETNDLIKNAKAKLKSKGCDWILANDARNIGADENHVHFISSGKVQDWGKTTKTDIAQKLIEKIIKHFKE